MALFNLTDIKFNRETRGPLNDIVSSEYRTNILKYPIDIGTSYDKGHYMVFYINQQDKTAEEFSRTTKLSEKDLPNVISSALSIERRRGASGTSSIINDNLRNLTQLFAGTPEVSEKDAVKFLKGGRANLFRTTSRTTDAIALYMPDTLNFTYNQSYSDTSVFETLGRVGTLAAAAGASGSILDEYRETGSISNLVSNVSPFIAQLIRESARGGARNIAALAIAAGGQASNPGLELLYSSPSFRSFRFDFMFYPRSQREAKEVIDIIEKLKFHQAPEISTSGGGRFLIPPSEFDIEFYYDGNINPNIPKVSTCVLEQIDIDYAPNGFSAYEVPGQLTAVEGGTGMPTGIRLSLQFKETQIITKEFLRAESYEISGGAESTPVPDRSNISGTQLGPLR